jgi:hypothetical protein
VPVVFVPLPPTNVSIGPPQFQVRAVPGWGMASGGPTIGLGTAVSSLQPELTALAASPAAIISYRALVTWAALDYGPVQFTASVGGGTGGTLTAALSSRGLTSGAFTLVFSDGETRQVTISGTSVTWAGALNAGLITTGALFCFPQVIGSLLASLGAMTPPRLLAVMVEPTVLTGGAVNPPANGGGTVPVDILQNPGLYGPAAGTTDPNGLGGYWANITGGYCANFVNANVLSRWTLFCNAFGAYCDTNPLMDAVIFPEDSALFPVTATGYPGTQFNTAVVNAVKALVSAFPHTNIVFQQTFNNSRQNSYNILAQTIAARITPGTADTYGSGSFASGPTGSFQQTVLQWGMQGLLGLTVTGTGGASGPDQRPNCGPMLDVQGAEIGFPSGGLNGQPAATCIQIITAANQNYGALRLWFTYLTSAQLPNGPAGNVWTLAQNTLAANPPTYTGHPANLP